MKYKLIGNPQGWASIEDCINEAAQDGWRFCAVLESKRISLPMGYKTRLSVVVLMEKDES